MKKATTDYTDVANDEARMSNDKGMTNNPNAECCSKSVQSADDHLSVISASSAVKHNFAA